MTQEAGNVRARMFLERAARDETAEARQLDQAEQGWRSLMNAADHREARRRYMADHGVAPAGSGS